MRIGWESEKASQKVEVRLKKSKGKSEVGSQIEEVKPYKYRK